MRNAIQERFPPTPPLEEDPRRRLVAVLVTSLEQAFRTKAWHGSTLRGALSRVSPTEAAWRPSPKRHNIWEIAVHCAYWKYIALRRLARRPPVSFPLKGSDWFRRPEGEATRKAWWRDLELLDCMHQDLREAVIDLTDDELDSYPRGTATTTEDLVRGVAFHDTYHCGQIQLLKRMLRARGSSSDELKEDVALDNLLRDSGTDLDL